MCIICIYFSQKLFKYLKSRSLTFCFMRNIKRNLSVVIFLQRTIFLLLSPAFQKIAFFTFLLQKQALLLCCFIFLLFYPVLFITIAILLLSLFEQFSLEVGSMVHMYYFLLEFEEEHKFNFHSSISRLGMRYMPDYLPCRYNNRSSFHSLT